MMMLKTMGIRAVARLLADNPDKTYWTGEIAEATNVNQSALAGKEGILQRLIDAGYLRDAGWVKSEIPGGSQRRTYQVTDADGLRTLLT